MKIKHIIIALLTIWTCAIAFGEGTTFDIATFYDAGSSGYSSIDIAVEKSQSNEIPISGTKKSSGWHLADVLIVIGVLSFFFLFMKYTWLNLELTNYNKFLSDHQRTAKNGQTYYPTPRASQYIFNMKVFRLQDALDLFSFSDYKKWSENENEKVYIKDI